jgi:small subunit ribosomal protein S7
MRLWPSKFRPQIGPLEIPSNFNDETALTSVTMPPRLNFFGASRSLIRRSRTSVASYQPRILPVVSRRGFADEKNSNTPKGPNEDVLGHVSEEAADVGRVIGETEPDLGQGTPVQDVCC